MEPIDAVVNNYCRYFCTGTYMVEVVATIICNSLQTDHYNIMKHEPKSNATTATCKHVMQPSDEWYHVGQCAATGNSYNLLYMAL